MASSLPPKEAESSNKNDEGATSIQEVLKRLHEERASSVEEVLRILMSDQELSDLTLEGTDGIQVFANRAMLAAQSPVFRRMLYGEFLEAKEKVVKLDCQGHVLQAIVEYCYTDKAEMLRNSYDDRKNNQDMELTVKQLTSLIKASHCYDLKYLREKTDICLSAFFKKHPFQAILFLDQALPAASGDEPLLEVMSSALIVIHSTLQELLKFPGLSSIKPYTLEAIIGAGDEEERNEYKLFLLVKKWVETAPEDHHEEATELVKLITLEHIEPEDLADTVADSGLVTSDQMLQAFKAQALSAHKQGFSYRNWYTPTWQSSGNDVLESFERLSNKVQCEAMRAGVHRWSMSLEKIKNDAFPEVGVVSTTSTFDSDDFLSDTIGGWCIYPCDEGIEICTPGSSWTFGEEKLRDGSVVTMALDLSETGTLSVSIDDSPPFKIDNHVRSYFEKRNLSVSLLPAATVMYNSRVRFLGSVQGPVDVYE